MIYNGSVSEIEKHLGEYLDYLEIEKGRSIKTRENYGRYLKVVLAWAKIKSAKEIDQDVVRNFRLYLARREKPSGSRSGDGSLKKVTQAYYIIALRNFLKYLIKRDIPVMSPDKIELPKVPQRQIALPEAAGLIRILKAPDEADLRRLRDKAILETLFSTGLRLAELCALPRYINLDRGEISIRGKGGKIRLVYISDDAKSALKNYLAKRDDADEALFVSFGGNPAMKSKKVLGRITPRAVERLVVRYAKKAGVTDRVTPHMLRHLFATDLLLNGADIRSVQELIGHANIATTPVYTNLTNKELRDVHKKFHDRKG